MRKKTIVLFIIGIFSFLLTGWYSLTVKSSSLSPDFNLSLRVQKETIQRLSTLSVANRSPEKRASSSVRQQAPAISVQKTVGLNASGCASENDISVTAGTDVYYCFTLRNSGSVTLTSHSIIDAPLGINLVITPTLAPGEMVTITNDSLVSTYGLASNLLRRNITSNLTNNLIIASTTITGSNVITASASAQVDVATTTDVVVNLLASNTATSCGNTTQVTQGTAIYYCVSIQNIGTQTIDTHTINIASLEFSETFSYPLAQLETVQFTTQLIETTFPGAATLGPNEINDAPGSTVISEVLYVGTRSSSFSITATAQNEILVQEPQEIPASPTPTATSTITPTAVIPPTVTSTSVPIPTITDFPTFTPTSTATQTSTPTQTPTITPTATLTPTMVSPLATPVIVREVQPPPPGTNTPSPTPTFTPTVTPTPTPTNTPIPSNTPIPTETPVPTETPTPLAIDTVTPNENAENLPEDQAEGDLENNVGDAAPSDGDSGQVNEQERAAEENSSAEQTSAPQNSPDSVAAATAAAGGIVAGELLADGTTADNTIIYLISPDSIDPNSVNKELITSVLTNRQSGAEPIEANQLSPGTEDFLARFPAVFDSVFTSLIATFGALWFLCGSVLFFAVAGLFAGLFFRQQERDRFQLIRTARTAASVQQPTNTSPVNPNPVNPVLARTEYARAKYAGVEDSEIAYEPEQYAPTSVASAVAQSTTIMDDDSSNIDEVEDDNWPASLP